MSGTRTTCPYCGVGCGVVVEADGALHGDAQHPANFGRLCSKGSALTETLDDRNRLLRPRVDGAEASWDQALDGVAAGFRDTIAEHGPDSVAFYVSGQFLTEDYYVANKLMKGFIGSANIDTNSRLCMSSTVSGHVRAFGADVVPGIYDDWDEADLAILVGSNTAWCHPVLYQRLAAARQKRGMRLVVIDPRRTASCESADLHLPLAIGSDVALFAGLLVHLAELGAIDRGWTASHTQGLDAALAAARDCAGTIEQVAALTKLPPDEIARFYALFAATERVLTIFSQGVNQSSSGVDKVNAIINCHLATGRIGRPGMGPFSVTGQPNAMGGREVGGLANQLAAHMRLDLPADVDRVRRFWDAPAMARRPGLKAIDLFDEIASGSVKAVWIAATNPAASMPRAAAVRRALASCPLVVVSDCWPTDTSALADIVLPAAGWGEKDGTVTNSERQISRQRAFRKPPGEARPDWWMFAELARRMGWGPSFAYRRVADIFREHAALSAFENAGSRAFDIGGLADLSDAGYDSLSPIRWPVIADRGASRLFGAGGFFTPDRRARIVATPFRPVAEPASRAYPFRLNTGRIRDQWHTMTRTGFVPRLMAHQDEPFLELSPSDAGKLSLQDGDLVRVQTQHGGAVLRAKPSAGLRSGEIFVPIHWTDDFVTSGPIARLVGAACDPVSGQPELKATAAKLAPLPTLWRGFLLCTAPPAPLQGFYGARIPVTGGHAFELRGWDPLPSGEDLDALARASVMPSPGAEWLKVIDEERGSYRFVSLARGMLESCLLIACQSAWPLPDRDTVIPLLGCAFSTHARDIIMTLRPSNAAKQPDKRKVCACFAVSRATIEQAIVGDRLTSVAEIGEAVKAGTNCGSCIPELDEMLRDAQAAARRLLPAL